MFGEKFKNNIEELKIKLNEGTSLIFDESLSELNETAALSAGGGSAEERDNLNKMLDNPVNLYSSTLPRAMETAKLISKGLIKDGLIDKDTEIKRIDYIQEKLVKGEYSITQGRDSVNATTKLGSDAACRILNREFNKDYTKIDCKNILGEKDGGYKDNTKFLSTKKDLYQRYKDFKKFVLPNLDTDKLNIIVSHSAFIKAALNFNNKMSNLDAYLVVYDEMGAELIDLRQLYIFNKEAWAEGAYDPPNRDMIVKLKKFDKLDYVPNSLGSCNYNRSMFASTKSEVSQLKVPHPIDVYEPKVTQPSTGSLTQKKAWWKFWGGKTKKIKRSYKKHKARKYKTRKRKKSKKSKREIKH